MNKRKPRRVTPDVVGSVRQQTAQAAELAQIAGQDRLLDPRTNPVVRPHADRLLVEQQRKALDAENGRLLRRLRVSDRRAADAEKTLEVIQAARQMASPARSVLALHRGRSRFMGLSMAASLSLSVGSAMGVADLAAQHGTSSVVGYLAEVGLTGLSTMAIMYRSHLGLHGKPIERGSRQSAVLWLLTIVPLTAGITANALSHGAVGVFCAIGAAAFAMLAHLIADQSSVALRSRADEVSDEDAATLERVAMGEELLTALAVEDELVAGERMVTAGQAPGEESPGQAATEPEMFSDEALAQWLAEPPEEGGSISRPLTPDTGGPQGAAKDIPVASGLVSAPTPQGVQIEAEQENRTGEFPRTGSAVQARRATGEQTRARVAEYMDQHPNATATQIADALRLGKTTVKRHRRDIRRAREGR